MSDVFWGGEGSTPMCWYQSCFFYFGEDYCLCFNLIVLIVIEPQGEGVLLQLRVIGRHAWVSRLKFYMTISLSGSLHDVVVALVVSVVYLCYCSSEWESYSISVCNYNNQTIRRETDPIWRYTQRSQSAKGEVLKHPGNKVSLLTRSETLFLFWTLRFCCITVFWCVADW